MEIRDKIVVITGGASGIGGVLAPARRDAVGCARHLARLRLRSGAGQPVGSASADPAGSWQGQPRLCGCGGLAFAHRSRLKRIS